MMKLCRCALAAMTVCASAQAQTMYVVESTRALSVIDLNTGIRTPIGTVSVNVGTPGGLAYNPATSTMYVSSTDLDSLFTLDLNTGIATLVGSYNNAAVVMHGLEFHDGIGQLFGVSSHNGGLYSINPVSGNSTFIGATGAPGFVNLGFNSDTNVMYATSAGNDSFYSVDVSNGNGTLLGPLAGPTNPNALAYNRDNGTMYLADNTTDTLYTVNMTSGLATPIGPTGPGNILGMAYVPPMGPVVTEVNWAAPLSGNWSNAANWNPQVVPNNMPPGQLFHALITPVGAPYVVTMDQSFTVSGFALTSDSAVLDIGSRTLTVDGDYLQSGASTLMGMPGSGGTVSVSGRAAFTGGMLLYVPLFLSNGSLLFTGSVTDGAPEVFAVEICDSNIEHNGSAGAKWNNIGADGPITAPNILLNNGATLRNGSLSTFLIESDATMEQTSLPLFSSVFTNEGVLRKQNSTGTTTLQNFQFLNTGTVEVVTGTLRINGAPLPGGALQTGVWIVRPASTLDFMGGSVLNNQASIALHGVGSNFVGLGSLRQNSAFLTLRSGRHLTVSPATFLFTNGGGATLAIGPNSSLTVAGTGALAPGSGLSIGVSSAAANTGHGRLSTSSTLNLGGALVVSLEGGFMPDWGDAWTIATYSSRAGNFQSFNFPALSNPNLRWWRENNPTTYRIGVRHVADTNHDNVVNFTDLNNVLSTFGMSGGPPFLIGDCNEDGTVNFTDLNLVLSVFGQMAPP